ncbi:cysteine-rich venom protein Cau1-like [Engraulis encrasicolus]|uniref:cysteine-rich venom protein Cau1-like n=1 Tax=Engraulis encrasicolus TaxID=184585 RepID=UPI002FD78148
MGGLLGIQTWYNEVKDYRYGHGAIGNAVVGHYTQVVWYRSNQIGCAMAHCPNLQFKYFYVCQYCPAGNVFYEGHNGFAHPYKKGPACGDCPKACDNGLCTNPCQYFDKCYRCPELVKKRGCNGKLANVCPASCKCHGSII